MIYYWEEGLDTACRGGAGHNIHRGRGYLLSSDDPDMLLRCENGRSEGVGKALKSALSLAPAPCLLVRRLTLMLLPRLNPVDNGLD